MISIHNPMSSHLESSRVQISQDSRHFAPKYSIPNHSGGTYSTRSLIHNPFADQNNKYTIKRKKKSAQKAQKREVFH